MWWLEFGIFVLLVVIIFILLRVKPSPGRRITVTEFTGQVTAYFLPADGPVAKAAFLSHMTTTYEKYIIAYAFTLVPMIDDLIAAHNAGGPIHLYLDYSQSSGAAEAAQLQRVVDAGIEVTIGTSPAGTQYICHTKGFVSLEVPPYDWEGSTNFSASAWMQVNTAFTFSSPEWTQAFINQFYGLRQFAWTNERDKQVMNAPPLGVT